MVMNYMTLLITIDLPYIYFVLGVYRINTLILFPMRKLRIGLHTNLSVILIKHCKF